MPNNCDSLPLASYVVKSSIIPATVKLSATSFGNILLMTTEAGGADATTRVKVYASVAEVEADYLAGSEVITMAATAFSQPIAPTQIAIGYHDISGTETLTEALTLCQDYDCAFYGIALSKYYREDSAANTMAIDWVLGKVKILALTTNDVNTLSSDLAAPCVALDAKGAIRTFMEYSSDLTAYPCVAALVNALTHDLNSADTSYTSKFQTLVGIQAENLTHAKYLACTGFVGGVGFDVSQGRLVNTTVNSSAPTHVEGVCLDGKFIDTVHYSDWLNEAMNVSVFNMLKSGQAGYNDAGFYMLERAVTTALQLGVNNGGIPSTVTNEQGQLVSAYEVTTPKFFDIPEALRQQRVLPAINYTVQFNNAIHYATVTGEVL